MKTLYEVLEYGPIVLADEDLGVLITINGSYLNWWNASKWDYASNASLAYKCADCRSFSDKNLASLSWAAAQELAQEWFNETTKEVSDETL